MKIFTCLCLLFSVTAWSKNNIDFNQAINNDVYQDIQKDDEKFKKEPMQRAPASVGAEQVSPVEETPKLDKNVRQIGPNKW